MIHTKVAMSDKSNTEDWINVHLPKPTPSNTESSAQLKTAIKDRRDFLATLRDIRARPEKKLGCKNFKKGCTCSECLSAYYENYRATDNRGLGNGSKPQAA